MENYEVLLSEIAYDFLSRLHEKDKRICNNNLKKLSSSPYPGKGIGDKEKLSVAGEEVFRLHIGRTYTVFYIIIEETKIVRVLEILSIEQAHKKYGY